MTRAAVLLAALVALGGCVTDARPDNCDAAAVTVELAVSADGMTPDDPGVCRDQTVRLVIDSAVDGELHIHGYDEAVPETELSAGEEIELEFVADHSGQFTMELHPDGEGEEIELGVFTVYEP
jgi:hypothetical protein